MDIASCLRAIPYLRDLSDAKVDALAFAFSEQSYEPGEALIELADRRPTLRILLSGEVSVSISDCDQPEVNRLRPGHLFGLLSAVDRAPASATCRAVGRVRVGELPDGVFTALTNMHADIGFAFQRALGHQAVSDFRRLVAAERAL